MIGIEYKSKLEERDIQGVWELLCECDSEFLPSLSSRNSTKQSNLTGGDEGDLPTAYFEEMLKQKFILCWFNEELIGFISFISEYSCKELESLEDSNYVSTVCVTKDKRGAGIATFMYNYLQATAGEEGLNNNLSTRTWSTNFGHIKILEDVGFKEVKRLKDHRGEGIDTIYFYQDVREL